MTDVTADAPAPTSPALPDRGQQAEATVQKALATVTRAIADVWHFFRFVLFFVYAIVSVVGFWLWLIAGVLSLLAFALRIIGLLFLWMAGGVAPPRGGRATTFGGVVRQDLRRFWAHRIVLYRQLAAPLAVHIVMAQQGLRAFWHWHVGRKAFAVVVFVLFVGVPALYLVPRPHEVQITDDNALFHEGGETRYLVHAVDIANPGHTREYENETAPWLLKINPQGIKSKLQNGRYYRLWVVGIRWYYMPMLFPNIIAATEIDQQGQTIDHTRPLAPPPTLAAPAGQ